MPLSALVPLPEPVAHADAVVLALDRCLVAGLARLGSEHRSSLESLGRVFAGTPLEAPVREAAIALTKSQAGEAHLLALAAARESLHGARYDALLDHAVAALDGRVTVARDVALAQDELYTAGPVDTFMAGTRQWLIELALAGFGQLEAQTVVPFMATLESLQSLPPLAGLSALLTGLIDEIMDNVPTAAMSEVPARRWADLWSRAMLGAWRLDPGPAARKVSGALRVLGADVRQHDHVISLVAYGLFDDGQGGPARLSSTTLSAWKVDAVAGDESFTVFETLPGGAELLAALAERKALAISGMELLATGELCWTGTATVKAAFDPMQAALEALAPGAGCVIPGVLPRDRHTVQLAVPVALPEVALASEGDRPCIEIEGALLPLAVSRMSPLMGLSLAAMRGLSQVFGLLRFDSGEWSFQPLLGKGRKGYAGPGDSIGRALKIKKSARTLSTLQERAGKLLRK
jgi:hypothetical protein